MKQNTSGNWKNYVLSFFNLIVLCIAISNLSYNNFVFPKSSFYSVQVWVWDFGFRILLYYPVFVPFFLYYYRNEWNSLGNIKLFLFVYIFLSVVANLPASFILLDGSFSLRSFFQIWIVYAISIPFVFFFLFIGVTQKKQTPKLIVSWKVILGAFFFLLLLRLVFTGPALPRLEDEVAYYLQSLIFESGQLKAKLPFVAGLSPQTIDQLYHLPYMFSHEGFYYSVHLHAWSYLLSFLGWLKPWANYIIYTLSIVVFWYGNRVMNFFPKAWENVALLLFLSIPILVFQSNTYMSHPFAMLLHMITFILWYKIGKVSAWKQRYSLLIIFIISLLLVLIWRPQVGVPLSAGLLLADVFLLFKISFQYIPPSEKKINMWNSISKDALEKPLLFAGTVARLFGIVLGICLAYLFLSDYADKMGSQNLFLTADYFSYIFGTNCQSLGFGEGYGCFPTLGTAGYSLRKVLIRFFEILSMGNQELTSFALPLLPVLLYLGFKHSKKFFVDSSAYLAIVFVCSLQVGVFLLYFHNGGENYRGRYLTEISYMIYYAFFYLLHKEGLQTDTFLSKLLMRLKYIKIFQVAFIVLACLFCLQFTRSRGDFVDVGNPSYYRLPFYKGHKIKNSLVFAKELLLFEENKIATNTWAFPSEFGKKDKTFTKFQLQAAFNTGFATLVATAKKVDKKGFLRDRNNNILVGELSFKELSIIKKKFSLNGIYMLDYHPLEIVKVAKNIKKIYIARPYLVRVYDQKTIDKKQKKDK